MYYLCYQQSMYIRCWNSSPQYTQSVVTSIYNSTTWISYWNGYREGVVTWFIYSNKTKTGRSKSLLHNKTCCKHLLILSVIRIQSWCMLQIQVLMTPLCAYKWVCVSVEIYTCFTSTAVTIHFIRNHVEVWDSCLSRKHIFTFYLLNACKDYIV